MLVALGLAWTANIVIHYFVSFNPRVEKVMSVDEYVHFLAKLYKVKEPLARAIIGCESQWNPENVHYNYRKTGELWSRDWSYWQLNDYYQEVAMRQKGWNIYDKWQNLQAGFYILKTQGTKPWTWSEWCWSKK